MQILSDVTNGLLHMHNQEPSIAHRDLKIENICLGSDSKWKIVSFGSSSCKHYLEINSDNRDAIEEDINLNVAELYRAPEQLDLYSSFPITEKVDIFALGCIIYTLLFFK